MKKLLIGTLLISLSAMAKAGEVERPAIWKQILSCDGGMAGIDVDTQDHGAFGNGAAYQVVIRNPGIVEYLKSQNHLIPYNEKTNEVIFVLGGYFQLDGKMDGYLGRSNDLNSRQDDYLYVEFTRFGQGYKLIITGIAPSSIDGDGQEHPERKYEVANWYFNYCK